MKALKVLAWIIGVLAALFLILLFAAPSQLHVERSIMVNAPANVVWDYLVKFENFNKWSTWRKADTAAVFTISGTDGSTGSSTSWKGPKIGEGKLENISLDPYKQVKQQISFFKPFTSVADVFFVLEETEGKTKVTWAFDANYTRPQNIMGMFMKGALEKDFQQGLDNMKAMIEAGNGKAQPGAISSWEVKETDFPAAIYAAIRKEVKISAIDTFLGNSLPGIYEEITAAGFPPGTPTGLIYSWNEEQQVTSMAAGIAVPADARAGKTYTLLKVPASKAVYVDFYGAYEKTQEAHHAIDQYLTGKHLKHKWPILEQYITDPAAEQDTSKWLTKVIYFLE